MNERKSGLEAGKMYIEVNPYKEPESRYVFQVEWAGVKPDRKDWGDRGIHIFGFITRSYPGDAWELYITTEFTEKNKDETWSEAVWDTSQKVPYWRAKTPEEKAHDAQN